MWNLNYLYVIYNKKYDENKLMIMLFNVLYQYINIL